MTRSEHKDDSSNQKKVKIAKYHLNLNIVSVYIFAVVMCKISVLHLFIMVSTSQEIAINSSV